MKTVRIVLLLGAFLITTRAADPEVWRYQLLEGSEFITENLLVGGAPVVVPMRGSFNLRLVGANPISATYAVEEVQFSAGDEDRITGDGTYELGGEVALRQTMTLSGDLRTTTGSRKVAFTNDSPGVSRRWPMIAATLRQTNGTLASTITLKIAAAPIREIWISTGSDFHTANTPAPDNEISAGDLLSNAGHVVKRGSDLQEDFPGPTYANIGLDALDLRPGAELAFSTDSVGPFHDGDIAFFRKVQYLRFADLLKPLAPTVADDPGLDALSFVSDQELYFSIEQDLKPATGVALGHGDLLWVNLRSNEGSVFRRNSELLSLFHPQIAKDYGLDAVYIWPSGEIWFSTRDGFTDTQLGVIGDGDILSDQGYLVSRNLELLSALAPIEDAASFGLDSLTIISDAVAVTGGAKLTISADLFGNSLRLMWTGEGRVFQVERAATITGPFLPISNIGPILFFDDAPGFTQAYYRVRQW